MGVLSEATYMKKYVGNINSARTKAYKENGLDMKKYSIVKTPYLGLFKIVKKQPHRDITGYLKAGNVHSAKNIGDRKKGSKKQSWESK